MKSKIWLPTALAFLVALVVCFAFTEAPTNVFSLITARGFFIPSQSSIFTFRTTVENPGSGEWWICGEDSHYFYAVPDRDVSRYLAFPKPKRAEYAGFQPSDYKTWPAEATIAEKIP